jgi:hypothetical protein
MTGWPRVALVAIALGVPTAALAGEPPPVTILRGSSAPPEPAPPPPPAPVVVERQTVIYLPVYSVSYWPPVAVNHASMRHRLPPATTSTVPNGWPLFGRDRR